MPESEIPDVTDLLEPWDDDNEPTELEVMDLEAIDDMPVSTSPVDFDISF